MMHYGTWIKSTGNIIYVFEQCRHTKYCRYDHADKNGWIATINEGGNTVVSSRDNTFCCRYNKDKVTKRALKALLEEVRLSQGSRFVAENIWTDLCYFGLGGGEHGKKEFMKFIREEIESTKRK